jgi:CRP-like cAMP-binding protein
VTDFLDEKRKEIQSRLKELKPLVDEYRRLEAAEQALAGVEQTPARTTRGRRGRGSATSNGRRGRPRGTGTRATQALELVRARPGITIPELAEAMGIKQNYLYRVMPGLADQGLVVKSGRGWHTRDSEAAAAPEPAA